MNFERINTGYWRSEDGRFTVYKDPRDKVTPWHLIDERERRIIHRYVVRSEALKAAENLTKVLR